VIIKRGKTVFLFFLILGCLVDASAQNHNIWADVVLDSLAHDQSRTNTLTKKYGDTLLQIFSRAKNDCNWIKTKIRITTYNIHNGDYKSALQYINEANSRYRKGLCPETPLLPEIYLTYATLYYHLNEFKKEEDYVQKGIDCWQKNWVDKEILIQLYELKGNLSKDFKQMMGYYQLGFKIAKETKNLKMQEKLLINMGASYAIEGKNTEADTYLRQALTLALQRQSFRELTTVYNNLAGIAEDNKTIASYLDSAIYYANLSKDLESMQTAKQNRALFYYINGDYKNSYDALWESKLLGDSLYNYNKIHAFADMEQKYEAEKKNSKIKLLEREKDIATLQASRSLAIDIAMGTALIGILLLAITFYSQRRKEQKLNGLLSNEKQKSDDLLLNILPSEIAEELKQKGASEAKFYNHVTVLFTDFVDFTGISQKLTPIELVSEINNNFTKFDAIIEQNGLEKIKTIGDAYMAVCGLPKECDDHAQKAVKAALQIQEVINTGQGIFKVRIGIHSGSVVAGIVGVKKYAYDVWGDTVNTASRMESYSEPGKINISATTFELVKNDFKFNYRGKFEIKGKGEMDLYFVEGLL
jgi:class 3 adenylate cyclase